MKAPQQPLNGSCGKIDFSTALSKVKKELWTWLLIIWFAKKNGLIIADISAVWCYDRSQKEIYITVMSTFKRQD